MDLALGAHGHAAGRLAPEEQVGGHAQPGDRVEFLKEGSDAGGLGVARVGEGDEADYHLQPLAAKLVANGSEMAIIISIVSQKIHVAG